MRSVAQGVLVLVLMAATSVEAAQVVLSSESRIPGFGSLPQKAEQVLDLLETDEDRLDLFSARLTLRPGERLVQAIKQTVFIQRAQQGPYNIPDGVVVRPVDGRYQQLAVSLLEVLGAEQERSLSSYQYGDSNSFGGCNGVVFAHPVSANGQIVDVTFLGRCWAE